MSEGLGAMNILIGVLMPILIAVLMQPRWSKRVRTWVMLGSCLIAGVTTAVLAGAFTGGSVFVSVLTVLTATVATYDRWWKPTGIAATVERATAIGTAQQV